MIHAARCGLMKEIDQIYSRIFDQNRIIGSLNDIFINLIEVLEKSLTAKMSDSVVLCGPSGSGKTKLASAVCSHFVAKNPKTKAIILNGPLHTQPSAAKELLLSLEADQSKCESTRSVLKQVSHILQNAKPKSLFVIVLEDIELFCVFKKQSLLYALLDSVQNSSGTLIVIGTSQRAVF